MGRAERRACDQTSADTEEATAAIPEDGTSAQEKNLRKQTVQGEKKERKQRPDWKGWKKDDEGRKEESGEEGKRERAGE